ncbi:MAG: nitroreductase [bacterium]
MDIYEIIKSRRSIRAFKTDNISKDIIERILDAAIWAPSAMNGQNWKFYVLSGEKRDQFAKLLFPVFEATREKVLENYGPEGVELRRRLYSNAGGAPYVIVVYAEEGEWKRDLTGPGMACQNILLAAKAEGLGSLFMGAVKNVKDEVSRFLGENDGELLGAILIGYPDEDVEPKPRRDDRITWVD